MAAALKARGLKVHLFQQGKRLLPNMDPDMTGGLEAMVKDEGIELHMEAEVKAFTEGRKKGHVAHVQAKGDDADVDAVLVAVGVEPSTEFAVKGGVQSTKDGYLLVDDNMKTNLHDVWPRGTAWHRATS